jgi:hypothetical protein
LLLHCRLLLLALLHAPPPPHQAAPSCPQQQQQAALTHCRLLPRCHCLQSQLVRPEGCRLLLPLSWLLPVRVQQQPACCRLP